MGAVSSGGYEDDAAPIADINVTPLVDVVLVLLVIFMVTAQLIVDPAHQVEVPKTATGDEVQSDLRVIIDVDGKLVIDGESFVVGPGQSANQVRSSAIAFVTTRAAKNPNLKAVVRADKSIAHGVVMRAIDILKSGNVKEVALASEKVDFDEK